MSPCGNTGIPWQCALGRRQSGGGLTYNLYCNFAERSIASREKCTHRREAIAPQPFQGGGEIPLADPENRAVMPALSSVRLMRWAWVMERLSSR